MGLTESGTYPIPAPPIPAPGCDVCAACFNQWREASTPGHPAFDRSHAADLAIEISRHPHPRAARQTGGRR
jgi:hypothetical protein